MRGGPQRWLPFLPTPAHKAIQAGSTPAAATHFHSFTSNVFHHVTQQHPRRKACQLHTHRYQAREQGYRSCPCSGYLRCTKHTAHTHFQLITLPSPPHRAERVFLCPYNGFSTHNHRLRHRHRYRCTWRHHDSPLEGM